MLNSRRKGIHTNNQDPSRSKKYTIFSTEQLEESKAARFFKSIIMVLYSQKILFNNHETRPVKRVHFDIEFPSISQSIIAENSESGKLLNTSITICLCLSVSVLHSLCSYNSFLYLLIYFCEWVYVVPFNFI